MTPAKLSVRHPIFIASIVILIVSLGLIALKRLPIDLYPDVTFPTIIVVTGYSGASPEEVEIEVSKVIEDEISSIAGVRKVSSTNRDGFSMVMAEFDLKSDLNYAEQQVRARVQNVMKQLPEDIDQPIVRQISPSDQPIMKIALRSDLPMDKLYDLAHERIAPLFEQVDKVGQVDIIGGRKREVAVLLDSRKLREADISGTQVVNVLKSGGRNIPAGKTTGSQYEYSYRTVAEFQNIEDIKDVVIRSVNTSYPVTIGSLATVENTLEDEATRTRLNGTRAVLFQVFRQSGANSVAVADLVKKQMAKVNEQLKKEGINAEMKIVIDLSRRIRANVDDVAESILLGIILTVIVVYFFLGSFKSTLITGWALPNSLLGACIFMLAFGFSINIMSLLAMSLVVGLLVDDAIVVRENIFRKLEAGMAPKRAAVEGTDQVTLAVIATTATILAVFGPIGNLEGIVGQFFKQFGLTICFAMIVSLFDGLFVAPAMSAYLAGGVSHAAEGAKGRFRTWNDRMLKAFDRFQTKLEQKYIVLLQRCMRNPFKTLLSAFLIFVASLVIARHVPFTFIPPQDNGEYYVQFELPAGSSLDAADVVATKMEKVIRTLPQVEDLLTTLGSGGFGSTGGESNKGEIFVRLVDTKHRKENTSTLKKRTQEALKSFTEFKPIVTDQPSAGGQRSFNLNIVGQDLKVLVPYTEKVLARLQKYPGLQQVDTSYREGRPEFQFKLNKDLAKQTGVTVSALGEEMRTLIEGKTPATYRENGIDYDIRVRLREDQRDPRTEFSQMWVPNVNGRLLPAKNVAQLVESKGPTQVLRENRSRIVQITADLAPGKGLGNVVKDVTQLLNTDPELKTPQGVTFSFIGEAERFGELMTNVVVSLGLGLMFIYLVLASLYGSFVTPFTIMLVIPLAAAGAFFALFITGTSFDLFSMIGCVMLMGLATKNSILLVDYAVAAHKQGVERTTALLQAGEKRLRPILMTSLALITGMIPIAIGLNEASKSRVSLGIVVIGGTISSTLLTLVVIPTAHVYIDRFQEWIISLYRKVFGHDPEVV